MKILVGNDWKSTAVGYASSVQTFSGSLTAILAGVALQNPQRSWLWAGLGALVLFLSSIVRIWLGAKQNYLQADPNIIPDYGQTNPAVVNVTTTGPVPTAVPTEATK
jgi:hypothetical protein